MDEAVNRTILSSMNDGVLVVGFDGHIVFVNRAAADILSIDISKITEKSYKELFLVEADNDAFNDIVFNGIQNREMRAYSEVPFRRSDRRRIELAVTTSFLRTDKTPGQDSGVVVVFKDITESKALDLARNRVLDHLSHELRTPLAILKATFKRVINPDNHKLGERIEQNLKRLEEIQLAVDDIVQRKHIENERKPVIWVQQILYLLDVIGESHEECVVAIKLVKNEINALFMDDYSSCQTVDLVEELGKAVKQAIESSRHRLVCLRLQKGVDAGISIDPVALKKALMTLLKNAIESTPDGGNVEILSEKNEGYVVVEIKDNGIGIAPESQAQIFKGFYHSRDTELYSTKKPYDFGAGGKGLELLRLKIFAEFYNFDVEFESLKCIYLPDESILCPGSIEKCVHVSNADECRQAGGTVFRLKFRAVQNT